MKYFLRILLTLFLFFTFGCEQTSDDDGPDPAAANAKVEEANKALAEVLYNLINNTDVQGPTDINFQKPYDLYQDAYDLDPTNKDANFGLGLTNFLMVTQNDDFSQTLTDWDNLFSGNGQSGLAKIGNRSFPVSTDAFELKPSAFAKTFLNFQKKSAEGDPKISDLQKVLEEVFLPPMEFAISAMDVVDDQSDFVFTITGEMQGDLTAPTLEIDLTEVYALEVAMNSIAAMLNMMVSYNVDFTGLDSLEALANFSSGGDFFTLRNNNSMNKVKTYLFNALLKMESGINYLRTETDDQSDDIIKLEPGNEADLDSVLSAIDELRDLFTNPRAIEENWDNDAFTPDEEVTFNFKQIFDNPITDFKAKLPAYSVEVFGESITERDWEWASVQTTAMLNPATEGYYQYYRSYSWNNYGYEDDYKDASIEIPIFDQVFDSLKAAISAKDNVQYISIYVYWFGYLNAGENFISEQIYYNYEWEYPLFDIFVPVITWNANSFEQWVLPDPTFNGFLPGMTDSEYKRIFGIKAEDWTKTP